MNIKLAIMPADRAIKVGGNTMDVTGQKKKPALVLYGTFAEEQVSPWIFLTVHIVLSCLAVRNRYVIKSKMRQAMWTGSMLFANTAPVGTADTTTLTPAHVRVAAGPPAPSDRL